MFVTKKARQTIDKLVDVKCDSCGKSTKDSTTQDFNYALLREEFGFGSEFDDSTVQEFYLCEDCYKKILKKLKLKRA